MLFPSNCQSTSTLALKIRFTSFPNLSDDLEEGGKCVRTNLVVKVTEWLKIVMIEIDYGSKMLLWRKGGARKSWPAAQREEPTNVSKAIFGC